MREQGQVAQRVAHRTATASAALLAVAVLLVACQPRPRSTETASVASHGSQTVAGIEHLLRAGEVASDAPFKRLLVTEKQRKNHRAPAALRALLGGFEILRMSMGQGVGHSDGRLDVTWFLAELGVAGEAAATDAQIDRTLTRLGFERAAGGERMRLYRKTTPGAEHEVAMGASSDWDGGEKQACSTSISWRIRALDRSPAPALRDAVAALPYLRDDRIPESFFKALADERIERIDLGGTWTRYYSLSLNFAAAASDKAAQALHGRVLLALQAQGLKIGKRSATKVDLGKGPRGAVAQLIGPDKRHRTRLHLQPQT